MKKDSRGRYFVHCLVAGCCAALAGISAKLITSPALATPFLPPHVRTAVCVASLVGCNLLMWLNFSTAVQGMRTVTATASTTTVNFLVSGLVGAALFGEPLLLSWYCGISLIVVGVVLLTADQTSKSKVE